MSLLSASRPSVRRWTTSSVIRPLVLEPHYPVATYCRAHVSIAVTRWRRCVSKLQTSIYTSLGYFLALTRDGTLFITSATLPFLFYQLGPDCKPAILGDDLRLKHASNDIPDGEIRPQSLSGSSEIKSLIDGRQDEKGILVSKRPMAF